MLLGLYEADSQKNVKLRTLAEDYPTLKLFYPNKVAELLTVGDLCFPNPSCNLTYFTHLSQGAIGPTSKFFEICVG